MRNNFNAKRNYGKNGHGRSSKKEVERFAFKMGMVNKGISNPNSRVAESYNKGKEAAGKKSAPKKPLF